MTETQTLEQARDAAHNEDLCHRQVPGTHFNYCGAPFRAWRLHTSWECEIFGHTRCKPCFVLHAKPQG